MAKSYEQLMQQIETLKTRAHAARVKEAAGVIQRMKEAIAFYGLTAHDLGLMAPASTSASLANGRKKATKPVNSAVRFKDDAGHTWTGRGPRPGWFKDALATGKTPDDLAA